VFLHSDWKKFFMARPVPSIEVETGRLRSGAFALFPLEGGAHDLLLVTPPSFLLQWKIQDNGKRNKYAK
jgi:hypothetical protein